jgi:peptide/nickel transport system substrate-binding protein
VLDRYDPDSSIGLRAREGYWGAEPKARQVDVRIVTDATTLETLVRSGEVDLAYGIPLKDVQSLEAAGRQVLSDPTQFFVYLGLNNKQAPLDDARVREALSLALPRGDLAERFGYGHVQTFDGPLPPAMPYSPRLPAPAPDVARAKALLREAGVSGFPLKLAVKSGESQQQEIATVIQGAFEPLGVDVQVQTLGAAAFTDTVGNFKAQSYLIKDGGTVNDPAYFLGFFIKCGNPYNWVQYCDRRVDELLAEGRFEFDPERRRAIYGEISETVARDVAMVPIFAPNLVVVADAGLKGYVYHDDQQPVLAPLAVG